MSVTHPDIDYSNKAVLAPMVSWIKWMVAIQTNILQVRIGTLPMRLVALDYGAGKKKLVDQMIEK